MGAGWLRDRDRGILSYLFSRGMRWSPHGRIGLRRDRDWFDDIVNRAEQLRPILHIAPAWPAHFRGDDVEIVVWVDGRRTIRGWVGSRSGVAVTADMRNWDFRAGGNPRDCETAAGLAIAWFLDSSLRPAGHPHYSLSDDGVWASTGDFRGAVARQRTSEWRPPQPHRVGGHRRRLRRQSPTDWARSNAPGYIREHMAQNETWVRPHYREGWVNPVIRAHLQLHSNLADAIGALWTA